MLFSQTRLTLYCLSVFWVLWFSYQNDRDHKHICMLFTKWIKNYFRWRQLASSNSIHIHVVHVINISCIIEKFQRFSSPDIIFRFYDNVDKYFGPLHYSRVDHVAYTIMKGRDYGLPDYNTVREQIGLRRMNSFEEINPRLAQENPSVQIFITSLILVKYDPPKSKFSSMFIYKIGLWNQNS